MEDKPDYTSLELGQIIELIAPNNTDLHNKVCFIDYIDDSKVVLLMNNGTDKKTFSIKDDKLTEETIKQIIIRYTPDEKGYAKQNDLIVGNEISIHFKSPQPITINGKISNLEEDMIEVTINGTEDKIYIDFGYMGLPEHLNIHSITLLNKEKKLQLDDETQVLIEGVEEPSVLNEIEEENKEDADDMYDDVYEEENEEIFAEGELLLGEVITIEKEINIPESRKIHDIDSQITDMLDHYVSKLKTKEMSKRDVKKIENIITRYKELRSMFSTFDTLGNVTNFIKKGRDHKPLVNMLKSMREFSWIIPVVVNKKILYQKPPKNDDDEEAERKENEDSVMFKMQQYIDEIQSAFNSYKLGTTESDAFNKYALLFKNLHDRAMKTYLTPDEFTNVLAYVDVSNKLRAIVNNTGNFDSSVIGVDDEGNEIDTNDFCDITFNKGLTYLKKVGKNEHKYYKMTNNDDFFVVGIITLPYVYAKHSRINMKTLSLYKKVIYNNANIPFDVIKNAENSTEELNENMLNSDDEKSIFSVKRSKFFSYQNADRVTMSNFTKNDTELYGKFLNKIIPRTKQIFQLIKNDISEPYSYKNIIAALEPFNVYDDDVSYKQYINFRNFVGQKIRGLNDKIAQNNNTNRFLKEKLRESNNFENETTNSLLFELFKNDNEKINEVDKKAYNLVSSDSSFKYLNKVFHTDNGRLFFSILCLLQSDLYQPIDIDKKATEILTSTIQQTNDEMNAITNDCDKKENCAEEEACIPTADNCENMEVLKKKKEIAMLNDAVDVFEEELEVKIEKLKKRVIKQINKNTREIILMKLYHNRHALRYNNKKAKLKNSIEERNVVVSPYAELRDKILGLNNDLAEKYALILNFKEKYCRTYNEIADESKYWFYCMETNTTLLPTFFVKLAQAFQTGDFNIYKATMDDICLTQGTIDGGDKVIDKYTSYYIKNVVFDSDEGFDENDRKIVTRAVLEKEEPKKEGIIKELDIVKKANSLEKQKIVNSEALDTFTLMDGKLSIYTNEHHNIGLRLMNEPALVILSKEAYEKQKQKVPYDTYYKQVFIFKFLAAYAIALQTAIPEIKPVKNYPGCKPNLKGFPISNDKSQTEFLEYLTCVITSLEPWKTLLGIKSSRKNAAKNVKRIAQIIKNVVNRIEKVYSLDYVTEALEKKRLYNSKRKIDEVISKYAVYSKWERFLPPLEKLDISTPDPLKSLTTLKTVEDKNVLDSKIIQFSFALISEIEKVTSNKELLLASNSNNLYSTNACCDEGKNSYRYFTQQNKSISRYNDILEEYGYIKDKYVKNSYPRHFMSLKDTKLKPLLVEKDYSDELIYSAFIKYCKFNTGILLPDYLKEICVDNNCSYNENDSMAEKIDLMKREGFNYNNASLRRLIQIVHSKNIKGVVEIPNTYSNFEFINSSLQKIKKDEILNFITEKLTKLLDHYGNKELINKTNDEVYNKTLGEIQNKNEELIAELYAFYKENNSKKNYNKFKRFINDLSAFKELEKDDYISEQDITDIHTFNFYKIILENITHTYPFIMKNKVNIKEIADEQLIPVYLNISQNHMGDMKKYIYDDFNNFDSVFGMIASEISTHVKSCCFFVKTLLEDIRVNLNNPVIVEKGGYPVFNATFVKTVVEHLFLFCLKKYTEIDAIYENIFENESEDDNKTDINDVKSISVNIINIIMEIVSKQKKLINKSKNDIRLSVLRQQEKEKNKVTEKFRRLNDEQKKIENTMKSLRLGDWGLGLTDALFKYDADVYDQLREDYLNTEVVDEDYVNNSYQEFDIYTMTRENEGMEHDVNNLGYIAEDGEEGEDGNADY